MNSKSKGNTFERKIANLLSERFETVTGTKKSFRRNGDSGSFFGGKNRERATTHDLDKATFGDVICPANFKYTLECKHYKLPPSLSSVIKQDVTSWNEWITQAEQDSVSAGKRMCIVVKYNNVECIVIVHELPACATPLITYKNCYVVPWGDFMALDDTAFFD